MDHASIAFSGQFWVAVAIFAATYLIIITEKIHRTVVALAGAVIMVLVGVLHQEAAIAGVDFNTLGLLIGMMVIVNLSKGCGMYEAASIWAAKKAKGNPVAIFLLLGLMTAVFSAFLDNVTTVLLMVPVTLVIASNLKITPKPFLMSAILLSNIGGTATLIGDPPNILIGSAANLSFNQFLFNLSPISTVVAIVTLGMLYFIYRSVLHTTPEARAVIMGFNPREAISDWGLLIKSVFVIGLVILGFLTHSITHLDGATIAIAGAALLLILTRDEPEAHLHQVEWTTIFFFIGLFIVVTGIEHVGAIAMLADGVLKLTGDNMTLLTLSILWGSAFFSAIVDNIPFVATMIPLIKDLGASGMPMEPLWWALALGADMGGNATIIGASANVIVSGIASREGHKITFVEYMKTAIPITFVSIVICTIYLYFRYL
ncbi:MAG TPA: ArsB/NhaD family transporter [Candidatus Peribacterales bacterium]|nr:ArsB/NhaD family transporter [Candidatus Peribacterales bacterium]